MLEHWKWKYDILRQSESEDDAEKAGPNAVAELRASAVSWKLTLFNIFLSTMVLTVVFLTSNSHRCPENNIVDPRYETPRLNPTLKQVSAYSPLLDMVDLTPRLTTMNGAFHDNETIFMQDPSPEVDQAWEMFSEDIFLTPWQTVHRAGNSLTHSIHTGPSLDGEAGEYIVQWDVFHQIHCLNWLRKAVNWEYYYGSLEPDEVWLSHQKHCIHMLLQTLMCHADVEMVTYEWMERFDHHGAEASNKLDSKTRRSDQDLHRSSAPPAAPVRRETNPLITAANFNVRKMCRNWDALIDWARSNKVEDPEGTRKRLSPPRSVKPLRWEDY